MMLSRASLKLALRIRCGPASTSPWGPSSAVQSVSAFQVIMALEMAVFTASAVRPASESPTRRRPTPEFGMESSVAWVNLDQAEDRSTGQAAVESRDVQVTAWCLSMRIDLPALHKVLVERFGQDKVTVFPRPPEHVHPARVSREFSQATMALEASRAQADYEAKQDAVHDANIIHLYYSDPNGHMRGEAVYAEYGSVVTWGIPIDLHSEVVFNLVGQFLEDPKDYGAIQADSMKVQVMDGDVKPTIRNDTMLLHHELFDQLEVRVGMSLALAQSTRLSMQEELTMRIIARTQNYPALLVQEGHVHIDEDDLAKTIGSVFLEKTELNLQVLSGPYNFPKFFSLCPDHVQKLYSLVSDNFNLDDRAEILNRRFSTLTDMLDLLRDQQSTAHEEHLSRIVIFLIFSTMCLGLLQILTTIFGAKFGAALSTFFDVSSSR